MTSIAFAGLTAAGKTTHAQRLAADLGYDYVSATDILFEILRVPRQSSGIHPVDYGGDLFVGQRPVVLEVLDADSLIDMPRRHMACREDQSPRSLNPG